MPISLQRRKAGSKSVFSFFSFRQQANSSKLVDTTSKKSYIPRKHFKLCSLHFMSEDFVTEDFVTDACPLIFKDFPSCYTHDNHTFPSGLSTTSFCFENEAARLEKQNKVF